MVTGCTHILLRSVKNKYILIGGSREPVFVVANSNTCLGNRKHQTTGGWSCNTPSLFTFTEQKNGLHYPPIKEGNFFHTDHDYEKKFNAYLMHRSNKVLLLNNSDCF